MKRNSCFYLISLILGILFCYFLKIEFFFKISIMIFLFFLTVLCYFLKCSKNLLKFSALFFVGFFILFCNQNSSKLQNFFNQRVRIYADVVYKKANSSSENFTYEIDVKSIGNKKIKERILLISKNNSLKIGDSVSFTGKLQELKSNTNPRLFNFKRYNLKKDIFCVVYSDDINNFATTENKFLIFRRNFNEYIEKVLDCSLDKENSEIMKRIFLNSTFDIEFENEVKEIGLAHILAISGLHIAIIYFVFSKIFSFFPISRIFREIFILILIFIYSNLIGNPASVVRAGIFFAVILFTKFSKRVVDHLNALFLTLFIILILNPYMIFDIGLFLSACSVFAIIQIFPKILKKSDGLVLKSFKLTFSVSLLILPVLFYVFGKFSILTFLANLILVPFFVIVICIVSFILILGLISLKISVFFGFFSDLILTLIRVNVEFLNEVNFNIYFENFGIIFAIIYYVVILAYFYRYNLRYLYKSDKKFILVSLCFLLFFSNFISIYENKVSINFIDIGQGDACIIKDRKNTILIDTGGVSFGNGNNGKSVLVPYLKKNGVKKIDYVFVSHFDDDHCKNLNFLSKEIKIKNLVLRKNGYDDYVKKYGVPEVKNIIEVANGKIDLRNIQVDILSYNNSVNENDKSLIMKVYVNGKKILFTGDITSFVENYLIRKDMDSDYLKVAHHGSKYSSTDEFLKNVSPKYAIISCGYKNRYNHPHKETLDRLEKANSRYLRTDLNGNIILEITRFDEKIVGYKDINENMLNFLSFYFFDILKILIFLFSFLCLNIFRRIYELHTGIETFGRWRA